MARFTALRRRPTLLRSRRNRWRALLLTCGVLLTAVIATLYVYRPVLLAYLDQKIYDTLLRASHSNSLSGAVAIVDVDDRSLAAHGQWPWPRDLMAGLLRAIQEGGARAVGLDVLFAEEDRSAAGGLSAQRSAALVDRVGPGSLPERPGLPATDRLLAGVLGAGPFTLGYEFLFTTNAAPAPAAVLHPLRPTWLGDPGVGDPGSGLFTASGAVTNLAPLAAATSHSGFFNASPDSDGILRRVPLLVAYRGQLYPSLALATLLNAAGTHQVQLRRGPAGLEELRCTGFQVAVDSRGQVLVHYRGAGLRFPYLSAADVLAGRLPRDSLRDKVVFVGTSAPGLKESIATPLDPVFPGVEVHATLADNILSGDALARPPFLPAAELASVVLLGLAATGILLATPAWLGFALVAVLLGAAWSGAGLVLQRSHLFFSPLFPMLTLVANAGVLTSLRFVAEERRSRSHSQELAATQNLMLQSLASLAESRDRETGGHMLRTEHYTRSLCRSLAENPRFRAALDAETIELLAKLAPLHDIGKVGVPDQLLRKDTVYSPAERAEMKLHARYGRDVIENAQRREGRRDDRFLGFAKDIVYAHHERWDGSGYPEGLQGERIPLAGRLVALVDVYEALVSERRYKPALSHEEAVEIILAERGHHFDPAVVDAFLNVEKQWRQLSREMRDGVSGGAG